MTVQPTRDQRDMWRQIATDAGDDPYANTLHPDEVLALLDQLDAAEQHIRDLTQEVRDERGAALDQMEQVRIRDARIKAVREWHWGDKSRFGHYCSECGGEYPCDTIRALDG